jgi:hypothetical protein
MFCIKTNIFQVFYVRIGILQMFCVRIDIFVRWCMMRLVKGSSIEHIEHGVAFPTLMSFFFLYEKFQLCPKKSLTCNVVPFKVLATQIKYSPFLRLTFVNYII